MPSEQVAAGGVDAGGEPVLATQAFLLVELLRVLDAIERPGVTDLYFVGFAPYGAQDVFRKDVEAAQQVMDERWDTRGRSIVLVNNPQTLLESLDGAARDDHQPARDAQRDRRRLIDADNDVVMVYLASHGSPATWLGRRSRRSTLVEPSPPGGLKQIARRRQGIKRRIIVVSASLFRRLTSMPLMDDKTIKQYRGAPRSHPFGCGNREDSTFFGEAFFQMGLATADSFDAAFAIARDRVAERERAQGYSPPSEPQVWVGAAMAEKLKTLRKKGQSGGVTARAPGSGRPAV